VYSQAKGVGSFLLDTVCNLADAKSWRVILYPVAFDKKRMDQEALSKWYGRRSFYKILDTSSFEDRLFRLPTNLCPMGEQSQNIRRTRK